MSRSPLNAKLTLAPSPHRGIVHIRCKSLYVLAFAFMRVQEYYESPNRHLNRQVFSLEDMIDQYTQGLKPFSYMFGDWRGFNIPGDVVCEFWMRFPKQLLKKEHMLFDLILPTLVSGQRFYLIGSSSEEDVDDHEIAHALFYLRPSYRKQMKALVKQLPHRVRAAIEKGLRDFGYSPKVWEDEIHAYLATSSVGYMHRQFTKLVKPEHCRPFRKVFRSFSTF